MLSEKVREVAREIGYFYLKKNGGNHDITAKDITSLQIGKIEINSDTVVITTGRPGLLIGRRGENIDALEKHLNMRIKILEDEDNILNYLIPYEYPYECES